MRLKKLAGDHRRFLAYLLVALVLFTAASVLLTWPLASHLDRYYFTPEKGGDGLGTIADIWYSNYAGTKGWTAKVTKFYGYPFGVDRVGQPTDPLTTGLAIQLGRLIGPMASYNVLLLLSFPLAGILMFLLLFYITTNGLASILGGFFYAFSPWHVSRTWDQLSLSGVHCLPLFLLALLYFWRKRNWISALALAAASVIALFTDLHFGLFCAMIAIVWAVAVLYLNHLDLKEDGDSAPSIRPWRRQALLGLLVVLLVVAVAIPTYKSVLHKDPTVYPGGEGRDTQAAVSGSAHPWYYVVPPIFSPLWRGLTRSFTPNNKDVLEVTAYPGLVTFALALIATWFYFRRKKKDVFGLCDDNRSPPEDCAGVEPGESRKDSRADLTKRVVLFSIISVIVAFVLSMPPKVTLGSISLPTPSMMMHYLVPLFRFYNRWALVVTFALCILAGAGFDLLMRRFTWSFRKTLVIGLILLVCFCLDTSIVPPWRSKDVPPPATVEALASLPKNQPVAFYPLNLYPPLLYYYYQMYDQHPMLNGVKPSTDASLYLMMMKDIYSPYTARMLSGLGINEVAVLSKDFHLFGLEKFDPKRMPAGYKLLSKQDDGYIYEVVAEPTKVFPLYYYNFSGPSDLEDGVVWTSMLRSSAQIQLVNKGEGKDYAFSMDILNPGNSGTLSVTMDGNSLGSVQVGPGNGSFRLQDIFIPSGKHELEFSWSGEPTKVDGTPFNIKGSFDTYLLFSRVALESTGSGNGR